MGKDMYWEFDAFRLDPGAGQLWHDNAALKLAPRAFAVLCHLVAHAGTLVSKDELLDAVWQHRFVSESVLKGCINEVRRALADDAKSPRYIQTLARRGYRFVGNVRQVESSAAPLVGTPGLTRALARLPRTARATRHLIRRSAALDSMQACFTQALSGIRQILFVIGEAGIGKTTLLEDFLETLANPSVGVLSGSCVEHYGASEPFLPLLEGLDRGCRNPSGAELVSRLQRWAPTWLAQMPGLLPPAATIDLQRSVMGATNDRMLREFVNLVEALAQELPLVLVIEDLHWSDAATLDALSRLTQRADPARVMIIGTFRPDDAAVTEHPVKRLFESLYARGRCTDLALTPFSRDELSGLLVRCCGADGPPDAVVDLLHRRTEGHPLFAVNVIDDWLARGILDPLQAQWGLPAALSAQDSAIPERLRVLIAQRVDNLPPLAQRILITAAAAGEVWCAALAAAAAELDVESVEQSCATLSQHEHMIARAGITAWPDGTTSGAYRFLHALYREVLYERLLPAQRARVHQRIAACLVVAHGDSAFRIAGEIAEHYERGCDYGRAITYLRQAAENAIMRFANREALAYLARAIGLLARLPEPAGSAAHATLLRQRVSVRSAMDDLAGAIEDLREIRSLAQALNEPALEVAALVESSRIARWVDVRMCTQTATQAETLSRSLKDPKLRLLARVNQAMASLRFTGWDDHLVETCRSAFTELRELNDPQLLNSMYFSYAWMEELASHYDLAAAIAQEGIANARRLNDAYYTMSSGWFLAWSLIHRGNLGAAIRQITEALRLAELNEMAFAKMGFSIALARVYEELLDFKRARECAEQALRLMRGDRDHYLSYLAHVLRGRALLGLQKLDDAAVCFEKVLTAADSATAFNDWQINLPLYEGLSRYHLLRGDPTQAGGMAAKLITVAKVPPERTYLGLAHRLQAELALAERNWARAQQAIDRALTAIHDGTTPPALWQVYGIVPVVTPASDPLPMVPLAAWRIYATAESLATHRRRKSEAEDYARNRRAVVSALASTLDPADSLRASFLQSALKPG